jgi:hypothetical protein
MATFSQYADSFNAFKAAHPVQYEKTGYQGPQADICLCLRLRHRLQK